MGRSNDLLIPVGAETAAGVHTDKDWCVLTFVHVED
jgi:hypothetical protein